jgi:hypothetical protein
MKALTIRQPWASLIVAGIKDVENRSWRTNYRGRLGIHAGSRVDQDAFDAHRHLLDGDLPRGALIGSVTVVDCIATSRSKWALPGHWHWVLADAKKLARPRPMPGKLGLWQA